MGVQLVGIRGSAQRIGRTLAVERSELQLRYRLVYLYVLRSRGHRFTFDDLLDFIQTQGLEKLRLRAP